MLLLITNIESLLVAPTYLLSNPGMNFMEIMFADLVVLICYLRDILYRISSIGKVIIELEVSSSTLNQTRLYLLLYK